MNFFNHIFSLQYVLSSSILKILPYIHVQIKLIQMQTIKILVLRLICIFFFWHLNLTVAKDSFIHRKNVFKRKKTPILLNIGMTRLYTHQTTSVQGLRPEQPAPTSIHSRMLSPGPQPSLRWRTGSCLSENQSPATNIIQLI